MRGGIVCELFRGGKDGIQWAVFEGARRKKSLNVKVSSTIENEIVFPAYIS